MKFLESAILFVNILLWLIGVAFMFLIAYQLALVALFCFLLFLVFYYKAEYFIISRLEKFVYSDWAVFRVKLAWANGQSILILIIISLIVGSFLDKT